MCLHMRESIRNPLTKVYNDWGLYYGFHVKVNIGRRADYLKDQTFIIYVYTLARRGKGGILSFEGPAFRASWRSARVEPIVFPTDDEILTGKYPWLFVSFGKWQSS